MTNSPITGNFGAIMDGNSDPRSILDQAAETGTVLCKKVCADVQQFHAWSSAMSTSFMRYLGGAVRRESTGDDTLFQVTQPGDTGGSTLHGEYYYMQKRPDWLWFYCEKPADKGGETLLCDGTEIFRNLPTRLQTELLDRKISYHRHFSPEAWARVFGEGAQAPEGWQSKVGQDGWIENVFTCSALNQRANGEWAFINSMLPFIRDFEDPASAPGQRMILTWDDGSPISQSDRQELIDVAYSVAHPVLLNAGDAVVVDNRWVLHGRTDFEGVRKMHARMA